MRSPIFVLVTALLTSASFAQPPGGAGAAAQGMPTNEIIFERNDTNKDGEITAAEAAAAGTALGQQFATWDTNSDGKVTNEELDAGRARLGGPGRAGGPGAGGRAGGPPAAAPAAVEPSDEADD